MKFGNSLKNLRDIDGQTIHVKLRQKAFDLTEIEINKIKKIPWLKDIKYKENYILLFYKIIYPLIYTELKKNYLNKKNIQNDFIFNYKNYFFLIKYNEFFKNYQKAIFSIPERIKFFFNKNKFKVKRDNNINIGVSLTNIIHHYYEEDLYWNKNLKVQPDEIIIYIKPSILLPFNLKHNLKQIKKTGNKIVFIDRKLFKINFFAKLINQDSYKNFYYSIKKIRTKNNMERLILFLIKNSLKDIKYWYLFFKLNNIKVNLDITESGKENIYKNIALKLNDSISVSKERSIFADYNWCHLSYYNSPIFFCWGDHSLNNYKKTCNMNTNLIISGNPLSENIKRNYSSANKNFSYFNHKDIFTILLIDNFHSNNNDIPNVSPLNLSEINIGDGIYTPDMRNYYNFFLNWVLNDTSIKLVVKPKKISLQKKLGIDNLLSMAIDTGRCININKTLRNKDYLSEHSIDMCVSINNWLSTALLENVLHGYRGVHFDYANKMEFNSSIYSWGKNKVIFNDFDEMKTHLNEFKNKNINYIKLGDWSNYINKIDPFRDSLGSQRIGQYIQDLHHNFKLNNSSKETIKLANKSYEKKWGKDKLYINDHASKIN